MAKIFKLILSFILALVSLFIPFFKVPVFCVMKVGAKCPDELHSVFSFAQQGGRRGLVVILIGLLILWFLWYLLIELASYILRKIRI